MMCNGPNIDLVNMNEYIKFAYSMVARQLKFVTQSDAFKISATRNIQYVFKKLENVYLIDFVKDIFDIYLNNIYHIVFLNNIYYIAF